MNIIRSACFDSSNEAKVFRRDGFFIRDAVVAPEEIEHLRQAISALPHGDEVRRKQNVYGIRNLFDGCPTVRRLAGLSSIREVVTPILGPHAFAVRATFFDKVPGANWSLVWHQDKMIPVKQRVELPGFAEWSQKAGIWHVVPPVAVLANMIAIRVHMDDCGAENGPLRVLPGSHLQLWTNEQIEEWKFRVTNVVCTVKSGGIVGMCPLTLHASSASESVSHRRVIHIEYAASDLPHGLEWHDRVEAAS